jgi:hypothetical protein
MKQDNRTSQMTALPSATGELAYSVSTWGFALMSRFLRAGVLSVARIALLCACTSAYAIPLTQTPGTLELAFHHAPVHFQDTDDSNSRADFITRFDYDANFRGTDNWDNLSKSLQRASAYYSVVESRTHWFITYSFFHPRDWSDGFFGQEHENDMEGLLTIVRKDGSMFGKIEGVVTVAHADFFSYTPVGSPLRNGQENIDGRLSFADFSGSQRAWT